MFVGLDSPQQLVLINTINQSEIGLICTNLAILGASHVKHSMASFSDKHHWFLLEGINPIIVQMVITSGYFYGIIGLYINHFHGIWGYFSDKHHWYDNVASFPVSSISPSGQDYYFERLSVTIGVPWELHSHTHHTHRWWIPIMALCLTV